MTCPYCNSKETISIIYLYRYNDNNTFVKKNNEEVKYSKKIRKPKRKNYDGTLITNHNHNKYCKNCGRVSKNSFGNNVNANVIIIGTAITYISFS